MNNKYLLLEEAVNRSNLPYRQNTDIYIYDGKGNVIARDMGSFIDFPGGGVDSGETPQQAAVREAMEEVGAIVEKVVLHDTLSYLWPPEFADTPKRKQRYKKFKGSSKSFLSARVKKLVKPTSKEGDAWSTDKLWMPIDKVIKLIKKTITDETKEFRMMQINTLTKVKRLK